MKHKTRRFLDMNHYFIGIVICDIVNMVMESAHLKAYA